MSDKPSPIEKANEYFSKSGFRLVPWLDENQEQTGYILRDKNGDLYEIDNLDMEVAATVASAFFDGASYGLHLAEGQHGLKGMGVQAVLANLRAGAITGINNPTLEELNVKLAGLQYRVIRQPEPWDGDVRGYVLQDIQSNKITWELESDDEELVCMLVNVLFYGIMAGADVGRDQALRIRALDQWHPPFDKAN